jgi:hypothetical protein
VGTTIGNCDRVASNNGLSSSLSNVQLDKNVSPKDIGIPDAQQAGLRKAILSCSRLITANSRRHGNQREITRRKKVLISKLLCVRPQKPRFRPYFALRILPLVPPVEEIIATLWPSLLPRNDGQRLAWCRDLIASVQFCPNCRMTLGAR